MEDEVLKDPMLDGDDEAISLPDDDEEVDLDIPTEITADDAEDGM